MFPNLAPFTGGNGGANFGALVAFPFSILKLPGYVSIGFPFSIAAGTAALNSDGVRSDKFGLFVKLTVAEVLFGYTATVCLINQLQ